MPLDKGMVFTLEPGIYIPEEKLGVRIEDMFAIRTGRQTHHAEPRPASYADEVEKAMAK